MTLSRSNMALAGCLAAVLLGLLLIHRGYDPYKAAQHVSFAWMIIWSWLGKRFGLLGMRHRQIFEAFRKEQPLRSPFDRTIFRGAAVLTLVSMIGWFR